MCAGAARSAQDRDSFRFIENLCQQRDLFVGRTDACLLLSKLKPRLLFPGLQEGNVSGYGDDSNAALRNRRLHRDLQHPWHLLAMRDQFAVIAAFGEELFRIGFLKIPAAYFTTWNLGGDGEHWHTTSVAIVKPIDQMHVARSAA